MHPVVDEMEIRRPQHKPLEPTFLKVKAWQRADRKSKLYRPTERRDNLSVERQISHGEAYSRSSGVELKFDSTDHGVDWNARFTWEQPDEVVSRYNFRTHSISKDLF